MSEKKKIENEKLDKVNGGRINPTSIPVSIPYINTSPAANGKEDIIIPLVDQLHPDNDENKPDGQMSNEQINRGGAIYNR